MSKIICDVCRKIISSNVIIRPGKNGGSVYCSNKCLKTHEETKNGNK